MTSSVLGLVDDRTRAAVLADLRRRVWNLRPPTGATRPYQSGFVDATDTVLDLIDRGQ